MMNDAGGIEAPTRWEKIVHQAQLYLFIIFLGGILLFLIIFLISDDPDKLARFSMDLAAVDGLNATAVGRTISPAFNLTVRADNPSAMRRWCFNGGEMLVSYAGVALAWGRVPVFCVERSAAAELTVLPWGWEVGLPEDLRRSLQTQWRMGTAQVLAEMKIFHMIELMQTGSATSFHSFKFMLN